MPVQLYKMVKLVNIKLYTLYCNYNCNINLQLAPHNRAKIRDMAMGSSFPTCPVEALTGTYRKEISVTITSHISAKEIYIQEIMKKIDRGEELTDEEIDLNSN